jgi:hypothetical protein
MVSNTTRLDGKPFSSADKMEGVLNMEAKTKWQCPKCGVGLPYNPTYKLEGLCFTCRTYGDSDRLLGGYRQRKTRIH